MQLSSYDHLLQKILFLTKPKNSKEKIAGLNTNVSQLNSNIQMERKDLSNN